MQHNEQLTLQDKPKNTVVCRDAEGNILFTRTNLVTKLGRLFTLEQIMNKTTALPPDHAENLNRKLYYFSVGNGGTEGGPMFPKQPNATQTALMTRIPFLINPVSAPLVAKYPLDHTSNSYYGKAFESTTWNIVNNQIAIEILLQIDAIDCRDKEINELGLYFCQIDSDASVTTDTSELFSVVNFPSEFMTGNKVLYITYTIYV
jgi:hypothetical protein